VFPRLVTFPKRLAVVGHGPGATTIAIPSGVERRVDRFGELRRLERATAAPKRVHS
jgi:hypothetical protein